MTDDLIARLEDESARCNEYQTQRQLEDTEAERDRLRALLREALAELAERLTVDEARDGSEAIFHWHERAERAEAERDRLRALLRDIRDNGINAPMEDRIDAALKDAP